MVEQTGSTTAVKIKVVLRWIQILDDLEPPWKSKGEFRFRARVSSENHGGVVSDLRIPETGHYDIPDHPGWNKVVLNRTLFEGTIEDHLIVELAGEELDSLTNNDLLDRYRREFRGDPRSWIGRYGPGDDGSPGQINTADPENMSNWRVCYGVEAG